MDTEKKAARLHIRIEPTLLEQLKQRAKADRLPFSLWLRRTLEMVLGTLK